MLNVHVGTWHVRSIALNGRTSSIDPFTVLATLPGLRMEARLPVTVQKLLVMLIDGENVKRR